MLDENILQSEIIIGIMINATGLTQIFFESGEWVDDHVIHPILKGIASENPAAAGYFVIVPQALCCLYLLVNIYRKHFNLFTRVYSSVPGNMIAFLRETGYLIAFITLMFSPYQSFLSFLFDYLDLFTYSIILCVFGFILIWTILEVNLFPSRLAIRRKHRTHSLTLLYFFDRHILPAPEGADVEAWRQRNALLDDPGTSPTFSIVDRSHIGHFDMSSRGYWIRYHELFGRVSYIGLFVRIIVSPIVAVLIAAFFSAYINGFLGQRAQILADLHTFIAELAISFGGFNALLFGPAFMPILDSWERPFTDDLSLSNYIKFSQIIFCFIVLVAMAKGFAGKILLLLVFIYGFLMLGSSITFTEGITTNYFSVIASSITDISPDNRWLGWLYRYSGFDGLVDELRGFTDYQVFQMFWPGIVFWVFSCARLFIAIEIEWAGRVTYRQELILPYISRGNPLSESKDPQMRELMARHHSPSDSVSYRPAQQETFDSSQTVETRAASFTVAQSRKDGQTPFPQVLGPEGGSFKS